MSIAAFDARSQRTIMTPLASKLETKALSDPFFSDTNSGNPVLASAWANLQIPLVAPISEFKNIINEDRSGKSSLMIYCQALKRKPDIVFGNRCLRCNRGRNVVKIGNLHSSVENICVREAVHEQGQLPGKTFRLPHPGERLRRISSDCILIGALEMPDEGVREVGHVGCSKVETLGTRRRHDMRGIAGKEQPTMAHGLEHEGP
jgi:hypothetical protein